jgi:hypothetical protein
VQRGDNSGSHPPRNPRESLRHHGNRVTHRRHAVPLLSTLANSWGEQAT